MCRTLWEIQTFRYILLAYSLGSFFSNGIAQWKAAFFIRSFGMQTGELGTWFALIWGLGGLIGIWLGGELATRYAAHDERKQLRGMALGYCGFGVISVGVYLSSDPYVALVLMGLAALGVSTAIAPMFATIQTLVPERMRAMSIALIFFVANLVGLGFGPLAAGALSDALRPMFGEESLRFSLLVLCPGYGLTAWFLWRAGRTVTTEISSSPSHQSLASEVE